MTVRRDQPFCSTTMKPSLHSGWKTLKSLIVFKKFSKLTIFDIFYESLSTVYVNVARFARNVKWDFLGEFQTLWTHVCSTKVEGPLMWIVSHIPQCFKLAPYPNSYARDVRILLWLFSVTAFLRSHWGCREAAAVMHKHKKVLLLVEKSNGLL